MYFPVSKILGFFALPSNFILTLGLAGALLLMTRRARLGRRLMVASMVLYGLAGLSPLGNWLMLPLEQRFPPWEQRGGAPDGIIILGGAINPEVSAARGTAALNEASERLAAAALLARRFPDARIIFSGGNGNLLLREGTEADFALGVLESLGVPRARVQLEDRSRNTVENAAFTKQIAAPKPGERWLLVTSAYHMPRAIGLFRRAGFFVEAYPVDFRTRGTIEWAPPFARAGEGLVRTDTAAREWIGLLVHWLSGHSSALFPGPTR
ncbi:MAG TPA: YdcF family protein [Xanthobacteraceae bacterium]|nr:YdcF family protein [Xanthobacteraceae bacterium]